MPGVRKSQRRISQLQPRQAGFTLVEVVVAMLIVAGMFVAALTAAAGARAGQAYITDRSEALLLAQELMAEEMARPFDELSSTPRIIANGRAEATWVNRDDLQIPSASPTGVRRITVTVSRSGRPLVELTALRTQARGNWEEDAVTP